MTALHADYTLIDGRLVPDVVVHIADGAIASVEPAGKTAATRLAGKALLPGFINAHSHAFQRVLRGRTEFAPPGSADDDFWSWRTAMYDAATSLSPEQIQVVSHFAYVEMLRAGFTHVAEFHYLHHQPDGTRYADPLELSRRVLAAAADAGLGVTLLRVAYQRGGAGIPASPQQRRFIDDSESYARALQDTRAITDRVGIAAHSVRALDRPFLAALAGLDDGLLHAHVSEQPAEIAQCLAEHGVRPVQLLADVGLLSPHFVGVHATHLDASEIALLGAARAIACICPTTERNLGDGLPPLRELAAAGARFAIGSDSHAVIDPFAEMAALENGERLRTGRRNVLVAGEGRERGVATTLMNAATTGGAAACRLDAGAIAAGLRADLVTVDLSAPQLAGTAGGEHGASALLSALALAGGAHLVRDVWVGGAAQVSDGHHPGWEAALADYETVVRTLV